MRLPNADRALVDIRKLRDYCLDAAHPRGKHKARVFAAALGITQYDAERLRASILFAVRSHETHEAPGDRFGARYVVDFTMIGPDGPRTVRTAWIVRCDEDFPRLTSCYVQTEEG